MEVVVVTVVSVFFVCSSDAVSHIHILLTPVYAIMHFHAFRREGYECLALVYGEQLRVRPTSMDYGRYTELTGI